MLHCAYASRLVRCTADRGMHWLKLKGAKVKETIAALCRKKTKGRKLAPPGRARRTRACSRAAATHSSPTHSLAPASCLSLSACTGHRPSFVSLTVLTSTTPREATLDCPCIIESKGSLARGQLAPQGQGAFQNRASIPPFEPLSPSFARNAITPWLSILVIPVIDSSAVSALR